MSLSELGEQSETKGEIMRKIKAFTVMMHWDDGEVQNVTMDIPSRIWSGLETMADMMEEDDARDRGEEVRNDNIVVCPHCEYECDIGGLIGANTNDCPMCGKPVLEGDEEPHEVNDEAQEQEYTCPKFEPAQEEI